MSTHITALFLRQLIEDNLGQYIGYYRFPNTPFSLIKAICVLPDRVHGENYPPESTSVVDGLEVVIHKPFPNIEPRLSGDGIKIYKWEIFINQWEKNDLLIGTEKLIQALYNKGLKFTPPTFSNMAGKSIGLNDNSSSGKSFSTSIAYSRVAIIEKIFFKP